MILAGLDEAGYGPLLGPLVVGCSAFEIPDSAADTPAEDAPCLWTLLRKVVSKKRIPSGNKLHINDSKLVYSPSVGIRELERSVLAILAAGGVGGIAAGVTGGDENLPADLESLLARTASHVLPELAHYPWYRKFESEKFPIEQDAISIQMILNAVRQEMGRQRIRCVHLAARIVPERRFNHLVSKTRNKGEVLTDTTAIHLDELLRRFGDRPMTIVCDRHGGRERYGPMLRLIFPDWYLHILSESEDLSDYRLTRGENSVRILFRQKAEVASLPVALASMLSKYLREALMRRFNAFWNSHLPQLTPTAGYYTDGSRFLRDIQLKREELGIADDELIRCR